MRFLVEKPVLAKALAHTTKVVERRNTYPILANVLIDAADGRVTLTATDLDIEIREPVAAQVMEPGRTTVPANMLADIVRKLPDGADIDFTEAGSEVTVKAGRSRFKLSALDPDLFPDLKKSNTPFEFSMPAADLAKIIATTEFAISHEETRYYLNGIYLHAVEGNLRGVSTDGHRLARRDVALPDGAGGMPGVIVPRKTVSELAKLLDGAPDAIQVSVGDTRIIVEIGQLVLTSKLIEGIFPDYNRVTPAAGNSVLVVDVAPFRALLDRVGTMASDRGGKAVKLTMTEGQLLAEVNNPDHGSSQEDLSVSWGADEMSIGFNARYLTDLLGTLPGKQASISFKDEGSPARIWTAEDESALFVLMPMRV